MKGLLVIILFCFANPLFTFGGNTHSNKGGHNPKELFSNPESQPQVDGIFDDDEFYKLSHDEKKHIKTESAAVDTNSIKELPQFPSAKLYKSHPTDLTYLKLAF